MEKKLLEGKIAFIAGIADDAGFGWAIAKALAEQGCKLLVGTWVPLMNIFETAYRKGKFDHSRILSDGTLLEFEKIYPIDASFDSKEMIPEEILENKRYKEYSNYSIGEVAQKVKEEIGEIDFLIHSLANAPEIKSSLLDTSRKGYLAALSASSYSYVSLLAHFAPMMRKGGASLSLTYLASEKIIPGYGGGMSSAKAALESDTRTLAFEVGRRYGLRVNTISAGPFGSRAAKAIGFIDRMINYSLENAPLQREMEAIDVGHAARFLLSEEAKAITGVTLYVDNGLHAMGVGLDSPTLSNS